MAAQPVRIEVHIHLGIEFTSASSARARFRSMTMLRKPFLRLTFTFGPSWREIRCTNGDNSMARLWLAIFNDYPCAFADWARAGNF
jgi:hypothetical protein